MCIPGRFSRNPWAKALSLIYVTVALIYIGGLGMFAVSGQPLHEAFWEVSTQFHIGGYHPQSGRNRRMLELDVVKAPSMAA